jgi:hypothetical protein
MEALSSRLREEIDLDSPSDELLAVVDQTMQPAQVSLWLRHTSAAPPLLRQGDGSSSRRRVIIPG